MLVLHTRSRLWNRVLVLLGIALFALWWSHLFGSQPHAPLGSDTASRVEKSYRDTRKRRTGKLWLLLSTHNRLFWYSPKSDEDVPLHSGRVRSSDGREHIYNSIRSDKHDLHRVFIMELFRETPALLGPRHCGSFHARMP